MKYIVLLLGILGVHFKGCIGEMNPEVQVAQGTLRGEVLTSKTGSSYFSFKGVPYAKPPLSELRFVDAKPPEPWYGVREALKEGNKCTQLDEETLEYVGEEDCLYLNVYTPRLPESSGYDKPLPVMFWIHGGGFVFGSGNSYVYGPDYIVSEGIVLVTINYRLGPFGFLYMKEAAPGNAGMKDQVTALRWVKKNIHGFGGDPNLVTIFGESAGGASVHFHMLSPMTEGLFHRALAQSGAAMNPWAFQRNPEEKSRRLGNALGCDQEDPEELVECLREKDYMAIIRAAHRPALTEADRARFLNFIFVPCLEYTVPGVEKFLLGLPEELTAQGRFHHVPYMTGATSQEGLLIWAFNLHINFQNETVLRDLDSKWDKNVWPELRRSPDSRKKSDGLNAIRNYYLDDKPLTRDLLQQYFDLYSDLEFIEGISHTLKYMTRLLKAPLYEYSFNLDDELNFLKPIFNISWPGAAHADELGYIFSQTRSLQVAEDSSAAVTRRRMVRLWANFAKFGNPTPRKDPLLDVEWKQCTVEECHYLEITKNLTGRVNLYKNRMAFWEKFYSHYS